MQAVFGFYNDEAANRKPTKRKDALFFAILPSEEARVHVLQIREQFVAERSLHGAPLKPERFHISVFGIGIFRDLRRQHIEMAKQAADRVSLPPFEMKLDSIASFGRARRDGRLHQRPLVLFGAADGLSELRRSLAGGLRPTGLEASSGFVPHITLLYGPTVIPSVQIDPVCFAVSEFVLIHSEVGLTRHHIVGQWQLGGRPMISQRASSAQSTM